MLTFIFPKFVFETQFSPLIKVPYFFKKSEEFHNASISAQETKIGEHFFH